jgi:hypothetical protein
MIKRLAMVIIQSSWERNEALRIAARAVTEFYLYQAPTPLRAWSSPWENRTLLCESDILRQDFARRKLLRPGWNKFWPVSRYAAICARSEASFGQALGKPT